MFPLILFKVVQDYLVKVRLLIKISILYHFFYKIELFLIKITLLSSQKHPKNKAHYISLLVLIEQS